MTNTTCPPAGGPILDPGIQERDPFGALKSAKVGAARDASKRDRTQKLLQSHRLTPGFRDVMSSHHDAGPYTNSTSEITPLGAWTNLGRSGSTCKAGFQNPLFPGPFTSESQSLNPYSTTEYTVLGTPLN
jgi:hypothetical protein